MAYTDRQLKDATQLAYMQCFANAEKKLIEQGKEKPFTVRELIEASIDYKDTKFNVTEAGLVSEAMTLPEFAQYSAGLSDEDKERISLLSKEAFDWRIVDIHDKNDENGFYACMIETDKKDAIIAFRGSESYGNNLIQDWLLADFGLLNSTKTNQQAEVERYADELIENGMLDKYDFLAATGHSLGGNLATHLNVISYTPDRMSLYEKLGQVVNMDGPGMSHDYVEKYADQIARTSSKLTQYKWSAIGNLLFNPPGEDVEFLESNESIHSDKKGLAKAFWRHDTKTLYFDENGKAIRGEQDDLSKVLGPVSRLVDKKARDLLLKGLSAKLFGGIISIDEFKDIFSTIGKRLSPGAKKSASLDVLGATMKDREINRESVNVTTKYFNNFKDKLLNMDNSKKSTEIARA